MSLLAAQPAQLATPGPRVIVQRASGTSMMRLPSSAFRFAEPRMSLSHFPPFTVTLDHANGQLRAAPVRDHAREQPPRPRRQGLQPLCESHFFRAAQCSKLAPTLHHARVGSVTGFNGRIYFRPPTDGTSSVIRSGRRHDSCRSDVPRMVLHEHGRLDRASKAYQPLNERPMMHGRQHARL